jgi:hypothetical protein
MSSNIDAGSRWFGTISSELESTDFGVVCLTPDNLTKPWIHFEAGALAKQVTDKTRVVPYLHGLEPSNVSPPLALFHGVKSDKKGTLSLLQSLNKVRGGRFEQGRLQAVFEKWWPDFERELHSVPTRSTVAAARRTDHEILEEVLAIVRGIQADGQSADQVVADRQRRLLDGASALSKESLRVQLMLKIAELEVLHSDAKGDVQKQLDIRRMINALNSELMNRLS